MLALIQDPRISLWELSHAARTPPAPYHLENVSFGSRWDSIGLHTFCKCFRKQADLLKRSQWSRDTYVNYDRLAEPASGVSFMKASNHPIRRYTTDYLTIRRHEP